MYSIVFWQNIPSIHQAPIIREVCRRHRGDVYLITEQPLPERRILQGWEPPNFSSAKLIVSPSREVRRQIIEKLDDSINIFSGIHAYKETFWAFKETVLRRRVVGITLEGRDCRYFKGKINSLIYKYYIKKYSKYVQFWLTIGELGLQYYKKLGVPPHKIYPYAYFVEKGDQVNNLKNFSNNCRKKNFIFIGQLIRRKGLDVFLRAVSQFRFKNFHINVVGSGIDEFRLKSLAKKLDLQHMITWHGSLPNDLVKIWLYQADYLVLPSRFDGWGAVVNEALMSGTPVIVSDACGSSDLIKEKWRGRVFKSESIQSLVDELTDVFTEDLPSADLRKQIKYWAEQKIGPDVAAMYLLEIFFSIKNNRPPPEAPWLQ